MATFLTDGSTVEYTPSSAVTAGDVVVQGNMVGIAPLDIAADALGALQISGVFTFDKDNTESGVTVGVDAYWDSGASQATPTVGSNQLMGMFAETAATADTTCRVVLLNDPSA